MVRETEEGSAGVVSFMTPRIRVLMLRCGDGSHIVKMLVSLGVFFTQGSVRLGYGDMSQARCT